MNTMTITVLDTATIFEAEETIYRYDLPGTGITKGWAIDGVLEQAKNQLPDWPDVEIIIDADTEIVDILSQALTGQAVTTIPTEADSRDSDLTEPDLAESEELAPKPARRAGDDGNLAIELESLKNSIHCTFLPELSGTQAISAPACAYTPTDKFPWNRLWFSATISMIAGSSFSVTLPTPAGMAVCLHDGSSSVSHQRRSPGASPSMSSKV